MGLLEAEQSRTNTRPMCRINHPEDLPLLSKALLKQIRKNDPSVMGVTLAEINFNQACINAREAIKNVLSAVTRVWYVG